MFKPGVESLGNQLLLVEIERSEAESVEMQSEVESLSIAMEVLVCMAGYMAILKQLSTHVIFVCS